MIPPRKLPGNSRRRLRMRKESAGRRLRPIPAAPVSGDHSPTIRSKRFPAPFRSRSAPVTGGVPGPRCPAPPAPARVPHPRGTERNGISISDQGMPRESSGSPGSAPPAPEHPALPFPPPPPLRTGLHPVRPPRSDRTRPAGPPPGGPAGTRTRVLPGPPAPLLGAARRGRAARGGAHRFRTADAHRPRGSTGPPRAGRGGPVNRVGALEIADGVPPRLCAPAFPVLQPCPRGPRPGPAWPFPGPAATATLRGGHRGRTAQCRWAKPRQRSGGGQDGGSAAAPAAPPLPGPPGGAGPVPRPAGGGQPPMLSEDCAERVTSVSSALPSRS